MTSIWENEALTRDGFLGGRVQLWQPRSGFRSGIDAVLLAAAVPAEPGQSVLDLGTGAGAAGACLMARVPGATVTGVELQPAYAELAQRNGLSEVVTADLTDLPAGLRARRFDHVMMNPPYFRSHAASPAPDPGRAKARGETADLADWIRTGAARLQPKGTLTVIQRADRLDDVLAALPAFVGSRLLQPLAPRVGRDATLVIVQGRHSGRADLRLRPALILHDGDRHEADAEAYSPKARAILRNAEALGMSD